MYENLNQACHIKYVVTPFKMIIELPKNNLNKKNMIIRCKITEKHMFLVDFFLLPFREPPQNFLSSMELSRVNRESETDIFLALTIT